MSLEKFHFWCQKVLPLVYDDSLSYYEVLCKVVKYLNNTMDAVDEVSNKIKNYDDAIANLESEYSSLSTTVNNNFSTLSGLLDDLGDRVSKNEVSIGTINATLALLKTADDTLQEEIDNLNLTVSSNYKTLSDRIDDLKYDFNNDSALAEIRTMVKELQNKMNNLTYDVYNYVLDERVSFDRNNYVIYQHMGNALTSEQYSQLGLSADDYKKYDMEALDYVKFSRDLLNFDWLYLPITGGKQSHSVGADLLANYMYQTMTADEYKALDLDADGYVALDKTAMQYLYYPISDTVALSPFQYMVMLTSRIESLEHDSADLQTSMTNAEGNITNLQTAVGTAETNITDLQTGMETANTNITDLQTRVSALEGA